MSTRSWFEANVSSPGPVSIHSKSGNPSTGTSDCAVVDADAKDEERNEKRLKRPSDRSQGDLRGCGRTWATKVEANHEDRPLCPEELDGPGQTLHHSREHEITKRGTTATVSSLRFVAPSRWASLSRNFARLRGRSDCTLHSVHHAVLHAHENGAPHASAQGLGTSSGSPQQSVVPMNCPRATPTLLTSGHPSHEEQYPRQRNVLSLRVCLSSLSQSWQPFFSCLLSCVLIS